MSARCRRLFAEPVRDYLAALDAMRDRGVAGLAVAGVAFALAWFVYVPIHELFHAWGCLLAGGTVTRLEIAPEYGGALLARIVPFVVAGSAYAGQLTGFDTGGNDAIYLATVLAPFLLTILIGVPLLKRAARPLANPGWRPWLLGASLPVAYAPFVSLPGDYYEAGAILVSRAAQWADPAHPLARWRGDDVFKLARELSGAGATGPDWLGMGASLAVGILLAFLTYHLGSRFALHVR
ncbi:MAG: hypothetical protein IPM02_10865 [Betaproteobacteria bacterium]|nr:hypothetical protein [Betaproteobacteria bacterium]